MARVRRPGPGTYWIQDDQGREGPVTHLGKNHELAPTDTTHARNATAFKSHCGLVYLWAAVRCRWKLGNSSVAATATDKVLPPDVLLPVPLFDDLGVSADHISVIRADGNVGATEAQIIECVD